MQREAISNTRILVPSHADAKSAVGRVLRVVELESPLRGHRLGVRPGHLEPVGDEAQ